VKSNHGNPQLAEVRVAELSSALQSAVRHVTPGAEGGHARCGRSRLRLPQILEGRRC